ncbi:MAG: polyphosphate polymerase domain-containing protein [Peptococcaceae bacterium]|nr:polyphosphate polymerase domain-containing protein [Peptococcaceae bacterium]
MQDKKPRHELKYLCSETQLAVLKSRITTILSKDAHSLQSNGYWVRSLYFDDYHNRCYHENESGTDPREKFRIRIYNHSSARISLELKRKEHGMGKKFSCPLTMEQYNLLIQGHSLPDFNNLPPLLRKFVLQMQTTQLRPAIITDYFRTPFVFPNGNVRITFDQYISSSVDFTHFFDEQIAKRPILPTGTHLMEVKYDEYLPDFIYRTLQTENLRQTTFSKFYLARKYALRNSLIFSNSTIR